MGTPRAFRGNKARVVRKSVPISSRFRYSGRGNRPFNRREQVPTGCSQGSPKHGLQLRSSAVHHYPERSVENVQVEVVTDCVGKRYKVLLAVFC